MKAIISVHAIEKCTTKESLLNYLEIQLKENGSIYFDNGYSEPSFVFNKIGFKYVTLYAITETGEVRFSIPNSTSGTIKLNDLTFAQLKRLVYIINDYYLFKEYETYK